MGWTNLQIRSIIILMTIEGEKFVKDTTEEEESIFVQHLVDLSTMVDDGLLNSTGAKDVFNVLRREHQERLAAIDILGGMIA